MKKKLLIPISCLLMCVACSRMKAADLTSPAVQDMLCGVQCLYVGLVALDLDPGSYNEFLEQLDDISVKGYSLGQLAEMAKKHGAQTLAVKTTLENLSLRQERFVCIAHVDGNHFVNIGDVEDGSVWVVNPPGESLVVRSLFEKRWDGSALLLSKTPLVREEDIRRPRQWGWIAAGGLCVLGVLVLAIWSRNRRGAQP